MILHHVYNILSKQKVLLTLDVIISLLQQIVILRIRYLDKCCANAWAIIQLIAIFCLSHSYEFKVGVYLPFSKYVYIKPW